MATEIIIDAGTVGGLEAGNVCMQYECHLYQHGSPNPSRESHRPVSGCCGNCGNTEEGVVHWFRESVCAELWVLKG